MDSQAVAGHWLEEPASARQASQLEALTRPLSVQLVISDDVHEQVQNESGSQASQLTDLKRSDGHAIRGLDDEITVWTFA